MGTQFGTQLIGQTEKALNAILERMLAGTGISEPQWVALTLTVRAGGPVPAGELAGRIAAATKTGPAAARERLGELAAAGLIEHAPDGAACATERGRAQWSAVRARIEELTDRLWGDLPAADLATAGSVLSTVLGRANAVLA
ncbi:hypothetical protein [Dactylosporangium salmoneum]|uniref:MarR family transcriptional regulator n=1 Tax=Dactylosporangium salmoneum TaxID=53361 RepID=A0ABN3FR85_9ACTN